MEYKIKSRIWIEANNHILLGEGRIRILKAIVKTGSLSKAAKHLNMSYKKAWNLLDTVNKSARKPVVITSIGGKNGGGAQLTAYGISLITAFDTINENCWAFLDEQLKQLDNL